MNNDQLVAKYNATGLLTNIPIQKQLELCRLYEESVRLTLVFLDKELPHAKILAGLLLPIVYRLFVSGKRIDPSQLIFVLSVWLESNKISLGILRNTPSIDLEVELVNQFVDEINNLRKR